ncbi:MAG: NUDIX domain-containing protein [Actinomycetaceae bacterium]|nr:NUDIX domain-containing protein [Actinomycetaceae bacterium]
MFGDGFTEWPLDADGYPHREAARVVLFDPQGNILMILGHDIDDANYQWWFTPGGGLEEGENPKDGALRELREETGLEIGADRLIGPVLYRESTFRFLAKTRKQDELFFVAHITDCERRQIDEGKDAQLTALEKRVLAGYRWWALADLAAEHARGALVFPVGLVDMAQSWLEGWDGVMLRRREG